MLERLCTEVINDYRDEEGEGLNGDEDTVGTRDW